MLSGDDDDDDWAVPESVNTILCPLTKVIITKGPIEERKHFALLQSP